MNALRSCCFLLLAGLGSQLHAVDYYLGSSAAAQPGVTVADLTALNTLSLRPGDRVFFQAGETFAGTLELNSDDAGTPAAPVVISSYGTGRATIAAGNRSAIKIYNAAGFDISRLNLVGASAATSTGSGIDAGVYLPDNTKLPYLHFTDIAVSGFKNGVEIWAWYSTNTPAWPGFRDVKLVRVEAFNNRSEGIKTWGTWRPDGNGTKFSHEDVVVAHCTAYENRGDPASTSHTGSGIVLSGVDRGTIEYSVAHDNGGYGPTTGGGPFGIWTWESRAVTIQYNLVYNQRSSSSLDGGAYDLDGGSSNCVIQYNYSYNNEGPAIGIIQFSDASPLVGSVVRYNISENDCRKNTQGVVYIGEFSEPYGIKDADIYGNTFFVSANPRGGKPPLVSVQNQDDIAGVRFRNNLFIASHNGPVIAGITTNPAKALYQNNNYWGGTFDLAKFRAGGQETLNGVSVGFRVDPQLPDAGRAGAPTSATELPALSAYVLPASSPLAGRGLDLLALFGVTPGVHDFYGVPISSAALDLGASAVKVIVSPVPEPTPEPSPEPVPEPPAEEPVPSTPELAINDTFSGSGSLSGRTPDTATHQNSRWSILSGTTTIGDGLASTNTSFRGVIESGLSDGAVESAVVLTTSCTGVILRCSDSSNYLRLQLTTTALQLQQTAAGKTTTLASIPRAFPLGGTYVLRAVLAGSTIAISVDGVDLGTFTAAFNQTATRHGLLAVNSGWHRWDSFTVSR